ncbi:phosphotransferase [Streptomyces sp. 6N223]|uniref:phosphotransferase n=1 Tax=Streptomyces sp. 6N223 TaxID=3457412 RepID=UPI003FD043BB
MDADAITVETGGYDATTPWEDPAWRSEALHWITRQLARHNAPPQGRLQARLRPWSVVLRIPLSNGRLAWFKANPPGSAFEPALAQALHTWVPGKVLEPLAVDTSRAWSLMPDGGPLFAQTLRHVSSWEEMMREYAQMQRALTPHTDQLLALGLPDFQPSRLPERFSAHLQSTSAFQPNERAALHDRLPLFTDWCQQLAASTVPSSLDHSDLHDGSVLASGGQYIFFDWGDASLAHPFTSLLVAARVIREHFGSARAPTALSRVRDAYLEPWTEHGNTLTDLRRLASIACRVAVISRADTWGRVFPGAHLTAADHDAHVARWLRELLQDPPL